jgi:copper(I)-binding protein
MTTRGMTQMIRSILVALLVIALPWSAPSVQAQPLLQATDGYVREMPPGQMNTAAFMHLLNSGKTAVEIVAAESPLAGSVELHRHSHADGMMRMEAVKSITVPAGGEFVFKSGDYHVMIMGLKQSLKAGENFPLVFITATGVRIELTLPVKPIVAAQDSATHNGHH